MRGETLPAPLRSMIGMKRWIVLFLLMVPLLASADSYWEGDAVLQRGDAAFESGLYAASNSFAPDTQLMVQNLENGKSTVVTVSQRMDSQSDILILLSPKAADAVGIPAGGIARVRITVVQKAASTGASASPEGTVSPDSDVNPAAAYAATPVAPQTAQPGQEQQPAEQAQQPAAQEQVPAAAQPGAAAASPSAEDAQILAEAASRNPQKDLFLPPREDQKFAYTPPAQAETAQTPQPVQAETPTVSGETAAPSPSQSQVPLAEAQPQQATTQETVTNGSAPAAAQSGQIALSAPETPPEQPAQATPAQTAQPATAPAVQPGQAQVVSSLPRLAGQNNAATFYVQLGAYSTQETAQGLAASLVQTYPVVVLAPAAGGRQIYKVLVGPLNKAESGTLLPLFRFRGFRDAFLRRE
jgi:rare lipoprotein A (peptidoglycan hydrolase)